MDLKGISIVQILRSASYGGVESHVFDLISECIRREMNVTLISLTNVKVNDKFLDLGIPIICLNDTEWMSKKSLINVFSLARELNKLKPRIVHLHGTRPVFIGSIAARIAGITNIVSTSHNSYNLMSLGLDGKADAKLLLISKIINIVGQLASKINITVCDKLKNENISLLNNFPKTIINRISSKTITVHNWVDLKIYSQQSPFTNDCKTITIGTISRLDEPKKGICYLIEAVNSLCKQGIDVQLKIAGDGDSRKSLEKLVLGLGLQNKVTFQGYCTDIPGFFQGVDIFVLPSLSEGFPLVNLEAMASSVPVISTNVGGVSEAVIDGSTGFLIEPANADSIVEKVKYLINNKGEAIGVGEKGFRYVKEKFDIDVCLKNITNIYKKLI